MDNKAHHDTEPSTGPETHSDHYRIRVKGHLGARWEGLFPGLAFTAGSDATTVITGAIRDQAELHAVLRQIRDLGLELISVERGPPG